MSTAKNSGVKPPLGSPPSIEWIAVDRLTVDESYQRSCANPGSEALIGRIALGWDWRLFQPLACARRADGAIVVIDGQHRLLGARRRGDILHLPCVVGSFESIADEATVFAAMNRQRKAMSKFDLYYAQAASGEPAVVEAFQVIAAAGLRITRQNNQRLWKPGDIQCIGYVVWSIKRYGPKTTERALTAIAGAYPGQQLLYAGTLLRPVAALATSDAIASRLSIVLGRISQARWVDHVRDRAPGETGDAAITRRLKALLDEQAKSLGQLPPVQAKPPAAPRPVNGAPFPMPAPPPPKRRKTFEEELEAARNGTAVFVERVVMPSRPATEVPGGSSLS